MRNENEQDQPVIPPANTVTVIDEVKKPVLYDKDGKPLGRRPIGFK